MPEYHHLEPKKTWMKVANFVLTLGCFAVSMSVVYLQFCIQGQLFVMMLFSLAPIRSMRWYIYK